MTAATVTLRLLKNDPCKEVVILTASDGDTYTARKFGKVRGVIGSLYEDTAALSIPLSFAISGAVITIHCTGLSAQKVCLAVYGDK